MADSMGRVSASFHPRFVVSAGGNFLPAGLHGAFPLSLPPVSAPLLRLRAPPPAGVPPDPSRTRSRAISSPHPPPTPGPAFSNNNNIRMGATFNDVFTPESIQIPWYMAAGAPDWAGNVSGAAPPLMAPPLFPRPRRAFPLPGPAPSPADPPRCAPPAAPHATAQRPRPAASKANRYRNRIVTPHLPPFRPETAEIAYNGTSYTGGRWIQPGLYYTWTEEVPGARTDTQRTPQTRCRSIVKTPSPALPRSLSLPSDVGAAHLPSSPAPARGLSVRLQAGTPSRLSSWIRCPSLGA